MAAKSVIRRIFSSLWRALDSVRKIVHLLLMLLVLALVGAAMAPRLDSVPDSGALVLAPQGELVDQLSGDPFERAIARAQGAEAPETLLRNLIEAIRRARDDGRIKALVLDLDGLGASGLSKLQELGDEIERFKESGKPVIASGDAYNRNQYYLAAHADSVYLHPMGEVLVEGYGRYVPYYKSLLDRLYVDYHVWTVGEYKSFVEPITRDSMSEADREASSAYLEAMWSSYEEDVTAARGLEAGSVDRYMNEAVSLLEAAGGDAAQAALDYGLVDELVHRDEVRARLREIVGEDPGTGDDFPSIGHRSYLTATRAADLPLEADEEVAIVVASGEILPGAQPQGTVGGESTARLIRRAAENDSVKALVLRVDSPGGSAFASEVIRRELEAFQESGRPVVVSMSSVAASGGYWISMGADEVWANPTTLTGSIGVGATLPTFDRTLEQIGVNVDGVGTNELAGAVDVTRPLPDKVDELIGLSVERIYEEFVARVAESRDMSVGAVEEVARGRVWIGSDAAERGLVDELGQLDDTVDAAAGLAGLEEDAYGVTYVEPALGFAERIALEMMRAGTPVASALGLKPELPESLRRLMDATSEPPAFARRFEDPRGVLSYCFCDVR